MMQIKIDAICKEFDIRAEEIFAFMDEENIQLDDSLMHDIAIDLPDFRKFVEYWRRQLQLKIQQSQNDLDQLDGKVDLFIHFVKGW